MAIPPRFAQILHMQQYKPFHNQSLRCILHCFFCTDNRLPELVTATNRQREETMEQVRKDHLLHWSKFSGWNVLVHCATGSANPSTSVTSNPCQPLCIQNTTLTTTSSDSDSIPTGAYFVSTQLPASVMVIGFPQRLLENGRSVIQRVKIARQLEVLQ